MDHLFESSKLCYQYPSGTIALNNLNLTINKGKKTALLGCNGAGKSTFIGHLNGIIKPTSGTLKFKGEPLSYKKKALGTLRQQVGIVMQDPDIQIFSPYVMDELVFGPLNFGTPKEEAVKRAQDVIQSLGLSHLLDQPTHQLSYGQKKQISIASILTCLPEVLVLDEPLAGLDPLHQSLILDMINVLSIDGITPIVCTHDVDFAYEWADHVLVFNEGCCIASASPDEVFQQRDVLEKGHLKMPRILDLYLAMDLDGIPPRNLNDFKVLLKEALTERNLQT